MNNQNRKRPVQWVCGILCLWGILGLAQGIFAEPAINPMATAIGKSIGFAMCGQRTEADAIPNVDIHSVNSQLNAAMTETDFFLSEVFITRFDKTGNDGTAEGFTIHRDKFSCQIFTGFQAKFQGSQMLKVQKLSMWPITDLQVHTAFFVVPAESFSLAEFEQASFRETLQRVMQFARKVEGPHRADKTPRDYLGIVFFMDKQNPEQKVDLILSSKPGGKIGMQNGITRNMNGWVMATVRAQFAYDSGPELFFNVFVTDDKIAPRIVSVYSTHSLIRRVQSALAKRGYDAGPIDGQMGSKTHAAIQAFQKDQGLHIDGRPCPALLRLLTTPNLPSAVKMIQEALNQIGYKVGRIDGQMNHTTKLAIQTFQKDRLLQPSGLPTAEIVSMTTDTAAIFAATHKQVMTNDSPHGRQVILKGLEPKIWPNRIQQP